MDQFLNEWGNLDPRKHKQVIRRLKWLIFKTRLSTNRIKISLGATLVVTTLFLASALYIQQPPNPLRAVIALGSAVAISVSVTSALLFFAKIYDSNRRSTI